jgi:hypothetical protein
MEFDSEIKEYMKFHTKTKQHVKKKLYQAKITTLITTNSMVYIHLKKWTVYSATQKVPRT